MKSNFRKNLKVFIKLRYYILFLKQRKLISTCFACIDISEVNRKKILGGLNPSRPLPSYVRH